MFNRRGWSKLSNARRAHYFFNGWSLCHKLTYFGDILDDKHDGGRDLDCKQCSKRLAVMRKRETVNAAN